MEVLIAKLDPMLRRFMVAREVERGGSTILELCLVPQDALEWRAAEYQIDPAETDLLMDVVLYETELPRVEETPVLYTVETVDEARDIHVGRIKELKARIRPQANQWKTNAQRLARLRSAGAPMEEWEPFLTDDALQNIRDQHLMELDVVEEKRLMVEQRRQRIRQRNGGVELMPGQGTTAPRLASGGRRVDAFRAMRTLGQKGKN